MADSGPALGSSLAGEALSPAGAEESWPAWSDWSRCFKKMGLLQVSEEIPGLSKFGTSCYRIRKLPKKTNLIMWRDNPSETTTVGN